MQEAMNAYEEEAVTRGHEAVLSSTENSLMLVDWEKVTQSPMFKYGLKQKHNP